MSRPDRIARLARVHAHRLGAVALAVALLFTLAPARPARANGAFPESFSLLLPTDKPQQIVLATNFGLIISDDAGASWSWTCERKPETDQGYLYVVGAAPADRFYAVSPGAGLAYSNDESCTWARAGGALDPIVASDVFPDPTDPKKVYAIAAPADGSTPGSIYASTDGGLTFGPALYTAPVNGILQGVESSRSDPKTIYGAMYVNVVADGGATQLVPEVLRSTDGGATWKTTDVTAALGMNFFYIVAVDPADPMTITVRVIEAGSESLEISHDAGQTFTKVATLAGGNFTSYVKLASGTILAAGVILADAHGFRSTDGGKTFVDWPVPHLRALAERDGKLYAAAKNFTDGWAVGVSTDEGLTFKPIGQYSDVKNIRACAQAACYDNCVTVQVPSAVWTIRTCGQGGSTGSGGGGGGTSGKSGCGCRAADGASSGAPLAVVAILGALAFALARRARRRRGRPRGGRSRRARLDTSGGPV